MDFRYFLKMESIVTWFGKEYRAAVPNLFGTRDQFCGRQFSHRLGAGFGRFKHIPVMVCFIPITVTSAPPQIVRH